MTDEEMIRKAENPASFYPSGERSATNMELATTGVDASQHLARSNAENERLRGLLTHFRNRLLAYAPLADDMIAEMDAALSYRDSCTAGSAPCFSHSPAFLKNPA